MAQTDEERHAVRIREMRYGPTEIESEYRYDTTELVHEGRDGASRWVVRPKSVKYYNFRTSTAVPKLGVMLVGWGGNNGSTLTAGVIANREIFSVGMPGNHSLPATSSSSSASTTGVGSGMIRFLLDSGASIHVVGDARLLCGVRRLPAGAAARFATLPDGTRLPIIGVGAIQMESFCIPDVYLVEGVTVNLISVGRLATNHGICCCFYRNRCQLLMLAGGNTVGEATRAGR